MTKCSSSVLWLGKRSAAFTGLAMAFAVGLTCVGTQVAAQERTPPAAVETVPLEAPPAAAAAPGPGDAPAAAPQATPVEPPATAPVTPTANAPGAPDAGAVPTMPLESLTESTGAPATPQAAPDLTNIPSATPLAEGTAPPAGDQKNAHLPHDLSPWNMFMSADIVVKAVMIGLAFASVVTWTVWLAKSLELTGAKRRLSRAFADINASASLAEAAQRLRDRKGVVSGLIELAAVELRLSADVHDKSGIKERVQSRLDGLASAAGRDMNRGTGVLATIGSTSPFVGLFGTVWGIMNSFIGISESQTTNLAIVAPGIAEALLATAIGLVAAIPAVIIYNQFARSISGYKAMIAEASAEVMRLVSRDLDRGYKIMAARAAE